MLRGKDRGIGGELDLGGPTAGPHEAKVHAAHDELERALLGERDEVGEHVRACVAVRVRDHHVAASRTLQGDVEGLLAGAGVGTDELNAQVALCHGFDDPGGRVGRSGVDDNQLEVAQGLVLDALDGAADGPLGVMGHHEHRDDWPSGCAVRHLRILPPRRGFAAGDTP